ncbi:ClC family H(+)/Cl(-) exchange transporter [Veillonella montpellierensis]|uniref:ClC family H(+)/Cl(-) exchange transporter n=1 Tax=Veillonella montpellierensis TaxID=187328 RepID=UPI0023F99888|nr:ClC family H(+)/Cl(-) exchange transporter [Veillonella montpellierensis]
MKLSLYRRKNTSLVDLTMNRAMLLDLIGKGALVGIIAGFFGATFRYFILTSEHWRWSLMAHTDALSVIGWLLLMVVMAFIIDKTLQWAPLSGGSGIPQIEGEMQGIFSMKPYRILVSKYIGGALTGLAGFSVGREGPSVQLGGAVGKIVSYWMKSSLREQRILTSAGAAAGLAAAFSAPVSGAIFVFEEVHKSFYPLLVIPTFVAALISNFITAQLFGLQPSLGFTVLDGLPLMYFPYLIPMGIGMGLLGVLFCRAIFLCKGLFERMPLSRCMKLVITFIVVALIGYDSQLLLGGGNDLVAELAEHSHGLALLACIVVGKILLTSFCYGSGAQGGIFLPMLVIGGAAGAFSESLLTSFGCIQGDWVPQLVVCAMGGMLAAAMRTPLLAILLVLEMTNSFHNIYAIGIVTIIAYLVAELCKEPPIYDSLLQAMTKQPSMESIQTVFQTKISVVSEHIGTALEALDLPVGMNVVSVYRNGQYLVPLGSLQLMSGDELQVSCKRGDLKVGKDYFSK